MLMKLTLRPLTAKTLGKALAIFYYFLKEDPTIYINFRDPPTYSFGRVILRRASWTRLRSSDFLYKPRIAVQRGRSGNAGAPGHHPVAWQPGTLLSPSVLVKKLHRACPDQHTERKLWTQPHLLQASQLRPFCLGGICGGSPTASNNLGNLKHDAAFLQLQAGWHRHPAKEISQALFTDSFQWQQHPSRPGRAWEEWECILFLLLLNARVKATSATEIVYTGIGESWPEAALTDGQSASWKDGLQYRVLSMVTASIDPGSYVQGGQQHLHCA